MVDSEGAASASRRGRTAKVAAVVGGAVSLVAAMAAPAGATDSGYIYRFTARYTNGLWFNGCTRTQSGLNPYTGYAVATSTNLPAPADVNSQGCSGAAGEVPSGYLYAESTLYQNGALCNTSSTFNGVPSYGIIEYTTSCTNPAGNQTWQGSSRSAWFKGQYCGANECYNGYKIGDSVWSPASIF